MEAAVAIGEPEETSGAQIGEILGLGGRLVLGVFLPRSPGRQLGTSSAGSPYSHTCRPAMKAPVPTAASPNTP